MTENPNPAASPAATPPASAAPEADPEMQALRDMASRHDRGEPAASPASADPTPATEANHPKPSAPASAEAPAGNPPAPVRKEGDPAPAEPKPAQDAAQPPKPGEQAKPSDYAAARDKKAKEAERLDKTWESVNARKAELERREAEISRREAEWKSAAERRAEKPKPATDDKGNTAEDYDRLAKRYEEEGDDHMALAAKAKADALRRQAADAEAAHRAPPAEDPSSRQRALVETLRTESLDLRRERPELQDPANPVALKANELIADPRFHRAGGIRDAVALAELMLSHAAEKASLESQLSKANAELETLRRATATIEGPASPGKTPARRFEDMTEAEQDAHLREQARLHDLGARR